MNHREKLLELYQSSNNLHSRNSLTSKVREDINTIADNCFKQKGVFTVIVTLAIHKSEKLHPQSIRKWIKKGELKAFLNERDYYVYGAVWKEFLKNRNKTRREKSSLDFNQFKCFKCKAKQPPLNNIITKLSTGFNGCIQAFGVCQKCGYDGLKRPYKRSELAQIKEIFKIELDEVAILLMLGVVRIKYGLKIYLVS